MSETRTVKCPICGEPYTVFAYYCGDQSACPECREKARRKDDPGMQPYKEAPAYRAEGIEKPEARFKP